MRWMPVGVCFWLRCSWTGCRVRTSLKVGHYNPDLVVSVYNELGGNPWAEIRATLGLAQTRRGHRIARGAAAGTHRQRRQPHRGDRRSAGPPEPGVPRDRCHRSSAEHAVRRRRRRGALVRIPDDELRSVLPVGPRCAVLAAGDPGDLLSRELDPGAARGGYLAAADLGQRASSHRLDDPGGRAQGRGPQRAARRRHRHPDRAATHLPTAHRIRARAASASGRRVRWSRRMPAPAPGRCWRLAPRRAVVCSAPTTWRASAGWGGGRVDSAGDYVWNLWRPYQCCSRRGQWFLFDINWIAYPP